MEIFNALSDRTKLCADFCVEEGRMVKCVYCIKLFHVQTKFHNLLHTFKCFRFTLDTKIVVILKIPFEILFSTSKQKFETCKFL